jgi:hypothetical protein
MLKLDGGVKLERDGDVMSGIEADPEGSEQVPVSVGALRSPASMPAQRS